MARINLLPWREERRAERKKRFYTLLASALILGALAVLGAHYVLQLMIDEQEDRNRYLKQEIAVLDKRIREIRNIEKEKQRLLSHMRVIQELQANRPVVVRLFDELVRTQPEGVYYSKIERKGSDLDIDGVSESNARISALMRNVDASDAIQDPRLNVIQSKPTQEGRESKFVLRFKQKKQEQGGGAEE